MKNIGLLEYHYHSMFFYTMARICKTKDTNVTLFTTNKIFSLMEKHLKTKDQYNIVLKGENESINSFLKRVEQTCNEEIDLLFINTIQESLKDLPHYFRFKPKCKTILTIHNVNAFLSKKITINIKKPLRTLDTILSSIIIQKNILPKFNGIVVYPSIKEYIVTNKMYSKEVFTLPFTFYDENKSRKADKQDKKIKFVVIGAIEKQRRDYDIVLDAFEKLFKKFPNDISLCLLGRPVGSYGQQVIRRCKKMKERGYNIQFFEEFVPEETFSKVLMESTVILSPTKPETRGLGVIKETYGVSKASGALCEAIQNAKPSIVPSELNIMKELRSSTLKYDSQKRLHDVIENLIVDRGKLEDIKKEACKNSEHFSLDILQKYFTDEILNNIDNAS